MKIHVTQFGIDFNIKSIMCQENEKDNKIVNVRNFIIISPAFLERIHGGTIIKTYMVILKLCVGRSLRPRRNQSI